MNEVTVVIPAFNAEKYLAETLESIQKQTVPPKEIIVVNDGSTDKTVDVIKAFQTTEPIRVYTNAVNSGIGTTRNNGASITSTPYIAFLSADDCYNENFIEMCLPHLNKNTATYTMYNRCNQNMKPQHRFTPPAGTRENIVEWALNKNMFINFSSVILPTKIFEKAKFERELRHGEDLIFLLDTVLAGLNWHLVPQPLLNYRLHGNQGTFTQHTSEFETLWTYLRDRLGKLGVNSYLVEASYQLSKKKCFPPWHRKLLAWGYHKIWGYR
jgi:glycosyltransferase involved in cell wall biosynthesis